MVRKATENLKIPHVRYKKAFNPGSREAVDDGCKCPVLDNGHGAGCGYLDKNGDPAFWINEECKMHGRTRNRPLGARKAEKKKK